MKKYLKLSAFVLSVVMLLSSVSISAFAADETKREKLLTGEFSYFFYKDYKSVFYYSDDYFKASGKEKNEHLRTVSFDLTATAFGNKDGLKSANTRDFLKKIGFYTNDIAVEQIEEEPTTDSIGTIISHKKTEYGNVIAVAVRGANYLSEWANNLRACLKSCKIFQKVI